jgi:hypothetical protein
MMMNAANFLMSQTATIADDSYKSLNWTFKHYGSNGMPWIRLREYLCTASWQ